MEYKVVSSAHVYDIESKINKFAEEGWEVKSFAMEHGTGFNAPYIVIMQRLT